MEGEKGRAGKKEARGKEDKERDGGAEERGTKVESKGDGGMQGMEVVRE